MNSHAQFATTRWSVVLHARADDPALAGEALQELCSTYWYPLYAFLRRQGRTPEDAADLTQGFLAQLIERHSLDHFEGRSRFRSFLLGALKNYVNSEWNHAHRQKRGGGVTFISLDDHEGEERYQHEPADNVTPEKLFDRRWAMTLLDVALAKLGAECAKAAKERLFEKLKGTLTDGDADAPYAVIGAELGMSEGSVKVAAHRLRVRYGQLLREGVKQTVTTAEDLEDEVRQLFEALR